MRRSSFSLSRYTPVTLVAFSLALSVESLHSSLHTLRSLSLSLSLSHTHTHTHIHLNLATCFYHTCSVLHPIRGRQRSIVMSVCMSVCLSVCLHAYLRNHTSQLRDMFCACFLWPCLDPPLTLELSVSICYELSVLWMTSYLAIMGPMAA